MLLDIVVICSHTITLNISVDLAISVYRKTAEIMAQISCPAMCNQSLWNQLFINNILQINLHSDILRNNQPDWPKYTNLKGVLGGVQHGRFRGLALYWGPGLYSY